MTKRLLLVLALVACASAVAAAKSYYVTLFQPTVVGSTELKPGDYKVEVQENKAVIRNGKHRVEANVKVETAPERFNSTSVRYQNGDGKYRLLEIRLGGTNTKLVFN